MAGIKFVVIRTNLIAEFESRCFLKKVKFDTVGGQNLASIKFVVIRPNLIAEFDHVVNYLVHSAYNMII